MTVTRTIKQVNKRIHKTYPTVDLVKGKGYFYLCSDDDHTALELSGLFSTSILVFALCHLTLERWESEVINLVKYSDIIKNRT